MNREQSIRLELAYSSVIYAVIIAARDEERRMINVAHFPPRLLSNVPVRQIFSSFAPLPVPSSHGEAVHVQISDKRPTDSGRVKM